MPIAKRVESSAKVATGLDTEEGAGTYQYDGNYQLCGVADSVLGSATYTYDAAGNRANSTGADAGVWQHNEVNQLTNSPVGRVTTRLSVRCSALPGTG